MVSITYHHLQTQIQGWKAHPAHTDTQASLSQNPVYILSASRTPIGSINGSLSTLTAPQLGTVVVKHALEKAGVKPERVEEIYLGNVVQAGVGQSPARQVGIASG